MSTSPFPARLYKYVTAETAITILKNQSFRFTQPSELNDPFEFLPLFTSLLNEGKIDQSELLNHSMEEAKKSGVLEVYSKEQLAKIYSGHIKKNSQKAAQILNNLLSLMMQEALKTFNSSHGILCLTEDSSNLLMWAHYADQHKGVLIEIDPTILREDMQTDNIAYGIPRKVTYVNERPKYDLRSSDEDIIFFTKSTDWSYENEWRTVLRLNNCTKVTQQIFTFSITKNCITSVTLGERCEQHIRKKIKAILNTFPAYRKTRLNHAMIDSSKYGIQHQHCPRYTIGQLQRTLLKLLPGSSAMNDFAYNSMSDTLGHFGLYSLSDINEIITKDIDLYSAMLSQVNINQGIVADFVLSHLEPENWKEYDSKRNQKHEEYLNTNFEHNIQNWGTDLLNDIYGKDNLSETIELRKITSCPPLTNELYNSILNDSDTQQACSQFFDYKKLGYLIKKKNSGVVTTNLLAVYLLQNSTYLRSQIGEKFDISTIIEELGAGNVAEEDEEKTSHLILSADIRKRLRGFTREALFIIQHSVQLLRNSNALDERLDVHLLDSILRIQTPTLDALSKHGMTYDAVYSHLKEKFQPT